jgi:tetratricopeptide (TPR) repeat protein
MRCCSAILVLGLCLAPTAGRLSAQGSPLEPARHAYEKGDYARAIELLTPAAVKEPGNGEIHLWLAKSYLEAKQYDAAVSSGEKAVASNPESSIYHQWLGEAYGEKADHASMLSALSIARKAQKEFEIAVRLDEKNFDAAQDLIEYNCTAPGMAGGGTDKAQPLIQKLMEFDAAEGHYGAGVCKAAKKDFGAADPEFAKALESKPKTADRIYGIGDYFERRGDGEKVLAVAKAGEARAPEDPRSKFYRAAGWILREEKYPEAEKLLREYLQVAPVRSTYPSPSNAHYWLGRIYEGQKNLAAAKDEYHEALKLNPKNKRAEDALKHLGRN